MRFARKLALALWIGFCLIYIANAAQRVMVEVRSFEQDMRRDHEVMGRGLAPATALIWAAEGQERALAVVERTNRNESQILIRWVDLSAAEGHVDRAAAPAEVLAPVERGEPVSWTDRHGGRGVHTYVPLQVNGVWTGALEFTESLEAEDAYIAASVRRVVLTTAVMTLFTGALTLLLGMRFVGRPIRALVDKARRVGAGDFSGNLELAQADEIGELAREMNVMSQRLAEARAQVEVETAARIAALEQLRHGDRLMTVGRLSSGLAHEIGTPLNVITQRAKMIATGEVEGAEARTDARIVVEQGERITHIVRQLLDFSRRRPPELCALDLATLIERVFVLLHPLARRRKVDLRLAHPEARVLASADPVQAQQVFTNLILNAIQAMPDGGVVSVTLASRSEPEGDVAVVEVRDDGPGIDPAHLPHLFDPFFSTKGLGEGTGLGLSVAWGIVVDHQGKIEVESSPGRGACFRVHLPAAEAA
jgi:signal transduction histidine kinase